MILYKTLIRWRNTKHKSKKYSRHIYTLEEDTECCKVLLFFYLFIYFIILYTQIHFHDICFRSRKRDIKFAADIMCKSVFVTRPQVPEKPPSLSPSLWSNRNSVEDSPPVATKHRAKQQITGIICGAYDSSRRIYVKWNPSSGSVEGRLVSCVSDFPTVSTDHFWNLCGGGSHVRVSYYWRWPSGALSSLSCAHAWGVGVLVWEKGWESIRLNVCDDEINLTVCKRLSETGDAVRVYVVCGVILRSFSQPPYWKYRRTGRSRVPENIQKTGYTFMVETTIIQQFSSN